MVCREMFHNKFICFIVWPVAIGPLYFVVELVAQYRYTDNMVQNICGIGDCSFCRLHG